MELLNGQRYWKKTLYDNCGNEQDGNTLWLYYYVSDNTDNKGQWIISPYWNTYTSAYARCGRGLPNPTDVTQCNGHWLFAPNGQSSLNGSYILDTSFNFRPGACPQLTCDRLQFFTDSDDPFVGVYYRESKDDQTSQNIYVQGNKASETDVWYLYFNDNIFSWIINDEIITDCSAVIDGTLTSIAQINTWPETSALNNESWNYYAIDATTETRYIECFGQIPTSDPTASDATGYPSPSPTCLPSGCNATSTATPTVQIYDRSQVPTRPTVNWPTIPTLGPKIFFPTIAPTVSVEDESNSLNCKLCISICIFIILAVYR